MSKMNTRSLSLLLALFLLFGCFQGVIPEAEAAAVRVDDYGRTALQAMSNGTALVMAYDRIVAAVDSCQPEAAWDHTVYNITANEIVMVMDAYNRDHPEHFWRQNRYGYRYYGTRVSAVTLYYSLSGEQLVTAKAAVDAVADQILSGIVHSMSEYDKELYLHDQLVARVSYVDAGNSHNIYGAFVEGKVVCEGYAKAFQYLLQRAGIQSFLALGTGNGGAHAWNYVRIDGRYYHVDPTWNDPGSNQYHMYFNQTDAVMREDHTIETAAYGVPVCNSTQAFYFGGKATYLDTYTVDSMAQLFRENSMKPHVYIPGDADAFFAWLESNIVAIAQKAGVTTGFSWGRAWLGREYILSISTGANVEVVSADGSFVRYSSLQQAVNACEPETQYVRLMEDVNEDLSLQQDLYVDLNGWKLSGTLTTNGYRVFGMDCATDRYTCTSMGLFQCVKPDGSAVEPQLCFRAEAAMVGNPKRYMTIATQDGYTFHRFYLGVTHQSLNPSDSGLGFKAVFYGDFMVMAHLEQTQAFSFRLTLSGCRTVSKGIGLEQLSSGQPVSLRISNYDAATFGETPLTASVCLHMADGTVIESSPVSTTLRSVVEAVNADPSGLSSAQLTMLRKMIAGNATIQSWNVSNLYS